MSLLIEHIDNGKTTYKCSCCGKIYEELPLCFGTDRPYHYWTIPEGERETRVELTSSLCVIDKKHFFHRGRLIIPIVDFSENLIFDIWTSISEDNFRKRNDLWNNPDRVKEEPYFGWLQTLVPTYGNTISLKTRAYEQEVGHIPNIEVGEENHPLTNDQVNGITYKRALEIVGSILIEQHKEK